MCKVSLRIGFSNIKNWGLETNANMKSCEHRQAKMIIIQLVFPKNFLQIYISLKVLGHLDGSRYWALGYFWQNPIYVGQLLSPIPNETLFFHHNYQEINFPVYDELSNR
jgi:hypothetical protein